MSAKSFYYQNSPGEKRKSQFHYDSAQDPDNQQNSGWFSSVYSKLLVACVGLICVVVVIVSSTTPNSAEYSVKGSKNPIVKPKSKYSTNSELDNADIRVISPGYGVVASSKQLNWKYIVEPARTQKLVLSSIMVDGQRIDADDDIMEVQWDINGQILRGSRVDITFPANSFGTKVPFTMTVTPKHGKQLKQGVDDLFSYTVSDNLMVKYIRREFRTLTSTDKKKFITAIQAIYNVGEAEGQKIYGSKFHNIEFFLYKHLNGAGRTDCDHWHDGAGLVPHHTAFTLEFEQALQAIDPTVTVPYWEYGMDAYLYSQFSDSAMFDKDFLGESDAANPEHRISDGSFWSEVKVPKGEKYKSWNMQAEKSVNPFINAYGVMRTPWNNNPSPYIGRHNTTYSKSTYSTVPSCNLLQSCFQSDSISDMNYCLNGQTHGPVHIMIGGSWGDETAMSDYSFLKSPSRILLFKILWRKGYTRCPETCESGASCRCAVPDEYLNKYGAKFILEDCKVLDVIGKLLTNPTDDDYLTLLRLLEHPGQAGEMFTSAAPFDPTFWPLHGSMERMLGYKRLMKDAGVVDFDETWGYPEYDSSDNAVYLPGVCDWSNVPNYSDLTLPICDTSADCSGHGETDTLEFSNFLNRGETYTNIEFYTFLHPNNEELPYVYDTYTFDYCDTYGYSFLDESTTKSEAGKRLREGAKKDDISSAM